jgi:hypothetical protein
MLSYQLEMRTPEWPSFLSFHGNVDGASRAIMVLLIALLVVNYSTLFEEEYTRKLIDLYLFPWWRILLVLLVISSVMWCPRVGILVALIMFFYLSDMNTLLTPMTDL